MLTWRISDFADLSGGGGTLAPGRWHSGRDRIVYLSDHPAAALLEIMVHRAIDIQDVPSTYQVLGVEAPDDIAVDRVDEADLPKNWREIQSLTQARGDRWLAANETALLRVPSAIVPFAFNCLLNPLHADAAGIHIASLTRAAFDRRLSGR